VLFAETHLFGDAPSRFFGHLPQILVDLVLRQSISQKERLYHLAFSGLTLPFEQAKYFVKFVKRIGVSGRGGLGSQLEGDEGLDLLCNHFEQDHAVEPVSLGLRGVLCPDKFEDARVLLEERPAANNLLELKKPAPQLHFRGLEAQLRQAVQSFVFLSVKYRYFIFCALIGASLKGRNPLGQPRTELGGKFVELFLFLNLEQLPGALLCELEDLLEAEFLFRCSLHYKG
jgi:hypothetical protein